MSTTSPFWVAASRDVVVARGDDALSYLQSQLSQDVRDLLVGGSRHTFVLAPNGKVDALARVARRTETEFALDTDAGYGAALLARLNRFRIRVKVELALETVSCVCVRHDGAGPAGALPAWACDGAWDLLAPAADELVAPPDGIAAGTADDLLRARIEAGWPAMGSEITEATIPAETGIVPVAVSFTKGCYPGQELVERMDSRGASAPRILRRLRAAGPLAAGSEIHHDGRAVGTVTSAAPATAGGAAALALLGRAVTAGAEVDVEGTPATVEALDGA